MKKLYIHFLFIGILTSCNSSKPVTDKAIPTTEGLVAYYAFDGDLDDETGNNDADAIGQAPLTFSFFRNSNQKAVDFSKKNRTSAVIDNTFDFEYKTICFWVKADEINYNPAIVFVSDNPEKRYGLTGVVMKNEGDGKKLFFNISSNPVSMPAVEGVWYHVTLVQAAKNYSYYINGSMIATGSFSQYISSYNGEAVTFLGTSRIRNVFFSGSMDELRIYNRALSAEEIAVIAAN